MSTLKPGKDYHLAEVRKGVKQQPHGGVTVWFAYCTGCGWTSRSTESKHAAEDDAAANDSTENECGEC